MPTYLSERKFTNSQCLFGTCNHSKRGDYFQSKNREVWVIHVRYERGMKVNLNCVMRCCDNDDCCHGYVCWLNAQGFYRTSLLTTWDNIFAITTTIRHPRRPDCSKYYSTAGWEQGKILKLLKSVVLYWCWLYVCLFVETPKLPLMPKRNDILATRISNHILPIWPGKRENKWTKAHNSTRGRGKWSVEYEWICSLRLLTHPQGMFWANNTTTTAKTPMGNIGKLCKIMRVRGILESVWLKSYSCTAYFQGGLCRSERFTWSC